MRRLRFLPVPLCLLALFVLAGSAQALSVDPPLLPGTTPPPAGAANEGEELEGECEEAEFGDEAEECEEEEREMLDTDGPMPPEECVLETARGRVLTSAAQDRVKLVVSYTAASPADAWVEFRARSEAGSLKLGTAHQRLSERGVLQLTERLTPGAMERLRTAKSIEVEFAIPSAPDSCARYFGRQLTIRRSVHHQPAWFQSSSIFGD